MARKVVWGIDIGQTALRGVKAVRAGDRIQVLAFDSVEYQDILAAPDVDRDGAIQQALRGFLARNRVGASDTVLVSIPGQSALIRFIKLPPVEQKRIPDIVRYEAHQQIPFPLEEVVWDYKALDKGYGPGEQVEVGIFAMRRDIVQGFLSNLMVCSLEADILQLAPMALYNYVRFDRPGGAEAQVVIDMGAENTELLICTATSVWPRSLPISGNDFTEAIMEKFKVPFDKAETLKRMAKESKYSKQVYQAMEPKLKRLVEEIQRSVGFYRSINPGVRMGGILALGGSFKLPGLAKYLSENLHLPISSLTDAQNFDMGAARNPRVFQENALSFGVALGLAVQGCELGDMEISLLPQELLQRKIIARKKPWAAAVAACAVLMLGTAYYSTGLRRARLDAPVFQTAEAFEKKANERKRQLKTDLDVQTYETKIADIMDVWKGRDAWIPTLRKIFTPVQDEKRGDKGPWLIKIVSEPVAYEDVVALMARENDDLKKEISEVRIKANSMEFDQSVAAALRSRARMGAWQPVGGGSIGGLRPGVGAQRQQEEEKPERKLDLLFVMVRGETTHDRRTLFINQYYKEALKNRWVIPADSSPTGAEIPARDFLPPQQLAKADQEALNLPKEANIEDFRLAADDILFAEAQLVGSETMPRFVNIQGETVQLPKEEADEWRRIEEREREIKDTGKSWQDLDAGNERLPTRTEFRARLALKGIELKNYTEFSLAFFVDPNGTLFFDVQKMKEKMKSAQGTGPVPGPFKK